MGFFFKAFPDISHISQNGLKKLFYNNKMPTYAELMEILKANETRGYSHYTKAKFIDLVVKRGLIPKNMVKINNTKNDKGYRSLLLFSKSRYAAIQKV